MSRPRQRTFRRSKAPIALIAILAFMLLGAFKVAPATVQSMYAPEFVAYSSGTVIDIGE